MYSEELDGEEGTLRLCRILKRNYNTMELSRTLELNMYRLRDPGEQVTEVGGRVSANSTNLERQNVARDTGTLREWWLPMTSFHPMISKKDMST